MCLPLPVQRHHHRRVRQPFPLPVVQFDDQIPAAAVDDVLHLARMVVHRRELTFANVHDLLGIGFMPGASTRRTVAQGKQRQPGLQKIVRAKTGEIPAQPQRQNLLHRLRIAGAPLAQSIVGPRRQMDILLPEKLAGLLQVVIDR